MAGAVSFLYLDYAAVKVRKRLYVTGKDSYIHDGQGCIASSKRHDAVEGRLRWLTEKWSSDATPALKYQV